MATLVTRPVRVRSDDIYFSAMSVIMLLVVVAGFAPTYFLHGAVFATLPSLLVHVHGAAFSCWMILSVVQPLLIANRTVRLHRTLGYGGAALAVCMVVLGIMVDTAAVRRGAVPAIFTTPHFILLNDMGVTLFGILVGCAVWQRRNSPVHKRLMLIATIGIMPPASTRIALIVHLPFIAGAVLYALLLSVIVYDVAVRRRPYMVTVITCLATAAIFPISKVLSYAPVMQRIVVWVQGHP